MDATRNYILQKAAGLSPDDLQRLREKADKLQELLTQARLVIAAAERLQVSDEPSEFVVVKRGRRRRVSAEEYINSQRESQSAAFSKSRAEVPGKPSRLMAVRRRMVLEHIRAHGPQKVTLLADVLGIPRGSITVVVNHSFFVKTDGFICENTK